VSPNQVGEPDKTPAGAATGFGHPPMGLIRLAWIATIAILVLAIWATGSLKREIWSTEAYFFWHQDIPVVSIMLVVTIALDIVPASWLARLQIAPAAARWWVGALALLTLIVGAIGVWVVFSGYAFSLDEFLANFDADIFASGRLMAPVPPAWQPYVPALQPMYMLPLPNSAWVSSYLPVNAGLRALGQLAHAEGLVNPLLSAFSIFAVWGVGRRLWPERPELALIAAGLLGTSSQLIVMSMTAYAMPAHLAFNLAWLWLFLRGGKLGHMGAIVVGFFATGIHQLIFHPLFVAPFILQLLFSRRWGLSALYIVAYALIGVFWVEYWPIATGLSGVSTDDTGSTGGDYLRDRITDVLTTLDYRNVGAIGQSLMRFVTWQNPLTAPLAAIGAVMAVRSRGPVWPLVLGIVLTLLVMGVATPSQTHGWGYRYLHGLLGSACLIAAWAWSRLTDGLTAPQQAAARGLLPLAGAVSLLLLMPLRAWEAWSFVTPYAHANAAIQHAKADVVIVDHDGQLLFDTGTIVRNDPLLRHGPQVMALAYMNEPLVRQVCATHSVAIFNADSAIAYGMGTVPWRSPPELVRLRQVMQSLNCGRPMLR